MKLQRKILLVFVVLLIAVLIGISVFFSTVLLASYSDLEEQYIAKDLDQAVNKLNDELFSISALVSVWGPWDDTYNFVNGKDREYIQSNLQPTAFDTQHLNIIVITNTKGDLLFSEAYDLQNKVMVPVPAFFSGQLDLKNPLMNMSNPHQITSGILILPDAPMLVVSQPIVHSDFSGQPQGVVIMGRYLDKEEIARLAALTQPSLALTRTDDLALYPNLVSRIRDNKGSAPGIIQQLNGDQVAGYALIRDLYGNDALVLKITEARSIYHQGVNTTVQVLLIILAGGLFLGILVIFLLDRVVLKRMYYLANQVHTIGKSGSTSEHVEIEGDDELSELATEINRMLKTIEQTQEKVKVSEARFRDLAEQLPLVIFEMDTTGVLTYVNNAGVEIFGVTEQKIMEGINIRHFLSQNNIEQMQQGLSAVMAGAKSHGKIYTLKQLDGNLMRAIVSTSLIHREGKVTGFRGIVIDISERIHLEEALTESEEYLQTLIRSIRVGIFVIDAGTHTIIDVNPAALEMMGTTKDAIINQICHKVICPAKVGRCPITDLGQTVDNAERNLLTPDGRAISIIKYVVPVMLHGKPCLLETFIDNSYRKQIELQLAESEEKFRALAENSADIIFSIDIMGTITYISPQVSRYGFTPHEIVGKGIQQFIHPDDQAHVLNNYRQEMHDRLSISSTFRIIDKLGNFLWIEENSNIKRDKQGNPTGMVGILRDVTDRVRVEEALMQSRKRLENILIASPVIVFETDPMGNLLFASELWERLIGYPFETMKGRRYTDILHPGDRDRVAQYMKQHIRQKEIGGTEARIIRPDGSVLWIFGQSVTVDNSDGSIHGYVGTITDITERKKIEETLVESEEKYRALTENTSDILYSTDMSRIITYVSPQVNKYGFLEGEVIGKSLRVLIHPEDIDRVESNWSLEMEKDAQFISQFRILDKWGMVYWFEEKSSLRLDLSGNPVGIYGILRDITERKKIEETLVESEEKYRALTENTSDILFSTDMAGNITYTSPQINKYGFLEEEVIGKSLRILIHPADIDQVENNLSRELEKGAQFISQFRILDKWGTTYWFEEKSSLRLDLSGNPVGIYGILRDITERKRVEDAIEIANKKLNLMNQITRHDILNTITGLLGCLDMAKATNSPDEIEPLLNDIRDLTRAIQRHITFTREYQEVGVHLPQWQNVNILLNTLLPHFEKSGLTFSSEFEKMEIYADPLLEKVFYNLIDNAIRYGETITTISIYPSISNKGLSLVFEDDGIGVPVGQKNEIFKRGVGKNTGMGLFLTAEILAITEITIEENGTSGKGARFEIRIPNGTWRLPQYKKG